MDGGSREAKIPRPLMAPDPSSAGSPADAIRADIWLWAARFFKTRALAADACKGSKVRRGGHPIKASTLLRPGDLLVISGEPCPREIRVLGILHRRVGAPLAAASFTELTDPAVLAAAREVRHATAIHRPAGDGRPTKLERRQIDTLRKALREMGYPQAEPTDGSGKI